MSVAIHFFPEFLHIIIIFNLQFSVPTDSQIPKMLPIEQEQIKKPKTPNSFKSICSYIYIHPKTSILLVLLFIQFLIISRSSPILFSRRNKPNSNNCPDGKVYVYELPPKFNTDLLINCDDLHPWRWECGIRTNNGYGNPAYELNKVLPDDLLPSWYRTNQFSSEVIFHKRILNYKCRTFEEKSATAFFIPFYGGLAVGKYLFSDETVNERDLLCLEMLKWIEEKDTWRRSNGSDHFLVLGRITWDFRRLTDPIRNWGSSFLNMNATQRITRFSIERAPWDYNDVGVPYPTGFHPGSDSDLMSWQKFVTSRKRTHLYSFIGATRAESSNDVRGILLSHCKSDPATCSSVDCAVTQCSNDSSAILASQLDSEFCLQPKGDSYTRRSVFDCMIAGSIPVFFWKSTAYDQYEWFLPNEPESYSVFIDYEKVLNGTSVKGVLETISKENVRKMRGKVVETIPRIVYANPGDDLKFMDAFEVAVNGVLKRIKSRNQRFKS